MMVFGLADAIRQPSCQGGKLMGMMAKIDRQECGNHAMLGLPKQCGCWDCRGR